MTKTHIVAHDSEILIKGGKTLDRKLKEMSNKEIPVLDFTSLGDDVDPTNLSWEQLMPVFATAFGVDFKATSSEDFIKEVSENIRLCFIKMIYINESTLHIVHGLFTFDVLKDNDDGNVTSGSIMIVSPSNYTLLEI